ncbi:MAG: CarD family transcriptional regulator [Alphaproteobacteria bacterium]|nr:CarD family transcriptional regulator [Alphaproteobacteria bacterium]
MTNSVSFSIGDSVVYPSHGVGKIVDIEVQLISNMKIELFVVDFEKDKMSMRIPSKKAQKIGLRHLVSRKEMDLVLDVLQSTPKPARGMWSRRAAEYEAKINSGSLSLAAEVVRDLYKNSEDTNRSYSERIIYESALSRLVKEYAVIYKIASDKAEEQVLSVIRAKQAA